MSEPIYDLKCFKTDEDPDLFTFRIQPPIEESCAKKILCLDYVVSVEIIKLRGDSATEIVFTRPESEIAAEEIPDKAPPLGSFETIPSLFNPRRGTHLLRLPDSCMQTVYVCDRASGNSKKIPALS